MKNIILDFAKKNDLLVGICDAEAIKIDESILKRDVPFVKNTKSRLDPKTVMKEAKSIIVLGYKYNKKLNFTMDDKPRGNISVGAVGLDYHVILKNHMNNLIVLLNKYKNAEFMSFVDMGPLMEKEFAKKAGLGFQGKNSLVIHPIVGSFFYIGLILTSLELEPYKEGENSIRSCGDCEKCVVACPSGAIKNNYEIDYSVCVSYLTQKKGKLTKTEEKLLGVSIYGCDICQNVCPYNSLKHWGSICDIEQKFPNVDKFLNMSDEDFKDVYGKTSAFWRGRKTLSRNAEIALKNLEVANYHEL